MAEQKLLASYRPNYPNKYARKPETLHIDFLYNTRFEDYVEIEAVRIYRIPLKYKERNLLDNRLIREYVFLAYYDDTKITEAKLEQQLESLGCDLLKLTVQMGVSIINNYTDNRIEDGKVVLQEQTEITEEEYQEYIDEGQGDKVEEIDGKFYIKKVYLEI